jgi:hypothetical protein
MKVYHASKNHNIKKLFDNSYVSLYPHIAYYMGLYYIDTNKTWTDFDLKEPYRFSDKINFKPNRKPDGIPTLYVCDIEPDNIIIHKNFPFEFTILKGVKCNKINNKKLNLLLKKSIKYLKLTDEINFY